MINIIRIVKEISGILSLLLCLKYFGGDTFKYYETILSEWWTQC